MIPLTAHNDTLIRNFLMTTFLSPTFVCKGSEGISLLNGGKVVEGETRTLL